MKDRNHSAQSPPGKESDSAIQLFKRNRASNFLYLPGLMLKQIKCLVSKIFRGATKGVSIAILVATVILLGHTVSAQTTPIQPLGRVPVPEPSNISEFIRNKTQAIALGKALFWDMQLGNDGIQSCASCHFNAGADSRSKNQINPGSDGVFNIGGGPNYQLKTTDYPFHKLSDPNNSGSGVISDSNDITGSEGLTSTGVAEVVPGSDKVKATAGKEEFKVNETKVRRVTLRNSPTVIDAAFNFRNFWDGRAQNIFNGVNPFGKRDPKAFVLKAVNPRRLEDTKVSIDNSSLASQALGPVLSAFAEIAAESDDTGAPFIAELSRDNSTIKLMDPAGRTVNQGSAEQGVRTDGTPKTRTKTQQYLSPQQATSFTETRIPSRRSGRKVGKKLLSLKPLGKQQVAADDSVLGSLSNSPQKGLRVSYKQLIKDAFKPEWWNSNIIVSVDQTTGKRRFLRRPRNRPLTTNEYTLMEYNFSLFFGLGIQAYEATLISDQTPFDKFLAGDVSALTPEQQNGWSLFQGKATCIACHSGSELTSASLTEVKNSGRIRRLNLPSPIANRLVQDTGFFNIGVRPKAEDKGLGGSDDFGNSLSEVRLAREGKYQQLFGEAPPLLNPPLGQANDILEIDGAFKAPGLRNVELTAPYFHNGGQLTLEQVIDFYNRGGDFPNEANVPLAVLNLSDQEKRDLVAFLKGLTDERVRNHRAPFDHPQLFVPNGHPGDQNSVTVDTSIKTSDKTTVATDNLLEIPAVGCNGGNPLPKFLANAP